MYDATTQWQAKGVCGLGYFESRSWRSVYRAEGRLLTAFERVGVYMYGDIHNPIEILQNPSLHIYITQSLLDLLRFKPVQSSGEGD